MEELERGLHCPVAGSRNKLSRRQQTKSRHSCPAKSARPYVRILPAVRLPYFKEVHLMKKNAQKRIEIVATDGFAPRELETLRHKLEKGLRETGAKISVIFHSSNRLKRLPKPEAENRLEVHAEWEEPADDSFEQALRCVEAL
jgi:hypothetical protein